MGKGEKDGGGMREKEEGGRKLAAPSAFTDRERFGITAATIERQPLQYPRQ